MTAILVILSMSLSGSVSDEPLPPTSLLKSGVENGEMIYFLPTPWNGMNYSVSASPTDIVAADLLRLVFNEDEIPRMNFQTIPPYMASSAAPTNILVRTDRASIDRSYAIEGGVDLPAEFGEKLMIRIRISATSAEAAASAKTDAKSIRFDPKLNLPSHQSFADKVWIRDDRQIHWYWICFQRGRAVVRVWSIGQDINRSKIEALARAVDFRIRMNEKLAIGALLQSEGVIFEKKVSTEMVDDMPLVHISAIKQAQDFHVTAQDASTKITHKKRTVKTSPFSWELETPEGNTKLEHPVIPYNGSLLVPAEALAKGLGLRFLREGAGFRITRL
ncbi:MAG: hypothetical protein ACR2HJ_05455 [Fimbriimonadales bacterium]